MNESQGCDPEQLLPKSLSSSLISNHPIPHPFFSPIVSSPIPPSSPSISLSYTMRPNTSMLPALRGLLQEELALSFFLLTIYLCGVYHFDSPFHSPDSAVKVPKIWSGPSKLFSTVGCGWMGGTEQLSSTKFSNGEEDGEKLATLICVKGCRFFHPPHKCAKKMQHFHFSKIVLVFLMSLQPLKGEKSLLAHNLNRHFR